MLNRQSTNHSLPSLGGVFEPAQISRALPRPSPCCAHLFAVGANLRECTHFRGGYFLRLSGYGSWGRLADLLASPVGNLR